MQTLDNIFGGNREEFGPTSRFSCNIGEYRVGYRLPIRAIVIRANEVEMIAEGTALTGWKMIVYAVVAIGVLLLGVFRLDQVIARHRPNQDPDRKRMGHDPARRHMFSDPDGRAWKTKGKRS